MYNTTLYRAKKCGQDPSTQFNAAFLFLRITATAAQHCLGARGAEPRRAKRDHSDEIRG